MDIQVFVTIYWKDPPPPQQAITFPLCIAYLELYFKIYIFFWWQILCTYLFFLFK